MLNKVRGDYMRASLLALAAHMIRVRYTPVSGCRGVPRWRVDLKLPPSSISDFKLKDAEVKGSLQKLDPRRVIPDAEGVR